MSSYQPSDSAVTELTFFWGGGYVNQQAIGSSSHVTCRLIRGNRPPPPSISTHAERTLQRWTIHCCLLWHGATDPFRQVRWDRQEEQCQVLFHCVQHLNILSENPNIGSQLHIGIMSASRFRVWLHQYLVASVFFAHPLLTRKCLQTHKMLIFQ